jgi:hypothetical protein
MDEKVKKSLDHLFKVVLYKNIGKFESKKITNEQEHGKPVVKGKSGEEAKALAKEYTYREFIDYLNQLYLNAAIRKPKKPKTVKLKHEKFRKAPRDPKSYRRRLYIPIPIYSNIENKIYKYGYASFDTSPSFIAEVQQAIDDLADKYEGITTIEVLAEWIDITPNPRCNICRQLADGSLPFDFDVLLKSGGIWNISHSNCDCKIIVRIAGYRETERLEEITLEHENNV